LVRKGKQRAFIYWHERCLRSLSTMSEFTDYVRRTEPRAFLARENASWLKRAEFLSCVRTLNLKLPGTSFLDLGPGYGDTLDICHEQQAQRIDFVDIDPFFFHYNRLKMFTTGYQLDFTKELNKLTGNRYNLIWGVASISGYFYSIAERYNIKKYSFYNFLSEIERLPAKPFQIIIAPYWEYNYNEEKYIMHIHHNPVHQILIDNGYEPLSNIPVMNDFKSTPITYHKAAL